MNIDRYHRQSLLPQIGRDGQSRLAASRVLLVGCGALGCVIADHLVRAGVGFLRVVDRDVVELTNLQRQVLFDEADARAGTPKAVAAAQRLRSINSTVFVEPIIADVHAGNVERLTGCDESGARVDLIMDGTDGVETRMLLNDVSVRHNVPWVYGACVGTEGRTAMFQPPATPCLRCLFPVPPAVGELPTCDTSGVLGPVAGVVGSLQSAAALQHLAAVPCVGGGRVTASLTYVDLATGRLGITDVSDGRRTECPACGKHEFEYLDRIDVEGAAILCGRNTVQLRPPVTTGSIDLTALGKRIADAGYAVERSAHLLRWPMDSEMLTIAVFTDGRMLLSGTNDVTRARAIYTRLVGV